MSRLFKSHRSEVQFPVSNEHPQEDYRNCQRGAYWALKSHKTAHSDDPAVVSIPTGGGKTALMMLAGFEYEASRVLLIVPSVSVREQLQNRFQNLTDLKEAGAISQDFPKPEVATLDGRIHNKSDWEEYRSADVVITLPNSISSEYATKQENKVERPPADLFDLVLVDEAHHSGAPSWRDILSQFDHVPQVLFTATPFRRKHEELPGRLVYHYPINKAHEDKIYNSIDLETIPDESQEALVTEAKLTIHSLQKDNESASMMIRAGSIDDAKNIAKTYNNHENIDVATVHSKSDSDDDSDTIKKLQQGDIDGVVVVDKFAEGLDVSNLQLAVFHAPPKSLPMTVQFIGRLARRPSSDKAAIILTTSAVLNDEATGSAVRQLYHENTSWTKIAPEVIEHHIEQQRWPDQNPVHRPTKAVNENNIRLYKTVTVYSLTEAEYDPNINDPTGEFEIYRLPSVTQSGLAGYITTTTDSPTWGTDTILESRQYDLHLFYSPEGCDYLFESTSNRSQANKLRDQHIDAENIPRVDAEQLSAVMRSLEAPRYQATGLTNTAVPGGSQPNYKVYYGSDVQAAVHHSDARRYTHGHVFATFESGDKTKNRGLSADKGKIWSNSKARISDFTDWCDKLAGRISSSGNGGIQNLEKLDIGKPANSFKSAPFAVILNPLLAATPIEILTGDINKTVIPTLELQSPSAGGYVDVSMKFGDHDLTIDCEYYPTSDQWKGELTEYEFRVQNGRSKSPSLSGDEFLRDYPPKFYTEAGKVITGGQRFESESDLEKFKPKSLCAEEPVDWSEYISEGAPEKPLWYKHWKKRVSVGTKKNQWDAREPATVLEALARHLTQDRNEESHVLFCDDMGGEVADFIEFCTDSKEVNLYHCKGGKSSGVSLGRFTDIYQQTVRSLRYVLSNKLIEHIEDRRTSGTLQHFVRGRDRFDSIKTDFKPTDWEYTVYGVNPGLELDFETEQKADKYQNVGRLLAECVEQVEQANAKFIILGANSCWEDSPQ